MGTAGVRTILLVDDEPAVRRVTKRALESDGYAVIEAGGGEEALRLALAHTEPINLLIADLVMPRVDGFTLSRRLAKQRPEMKQLWISGYAERSPAVHQDLQSSDTPFLTKPYTLRELIRKVHGVLGEASRSSPSAFGSLRQSTEG